MKIKGKYYIFITSTLLFLAALFIIPNAMALSEYGIRCDANKECVKCRDNITCIKCIHKCENAYGSADGSTKRTVKQDEDLLCQLKRAKWCNAQCWDPDDYKDPEYISTKPDCSDRAFINKVLE